MIQTITYHNLYFHFFTEIFERGPNRAGGDIGAGDVGRGNLRAAYNKDACASGAWVVSRSRAIHRVEASLSAQPLSSFSTKRSPLVFLNQQVLALVFEFSAAPPRPLPPEVSLPAVGQKTAVYNSSGASYQRARQLASQPARQPPATM